MGVGESNESSGQREEEESTEKSINFLEYDDGRRRIMAGDEEKSE